MTKKIHLICNAHLDPVWLWQWEEGAAEAVSTFRVAADFCEQYEGFVFNHNEAILYQWVEEYEPELFARIQRLVAEGKWQIMGGWYLQPDCNMPSGEALIRQIQLGRKYFSAKFGVEPEVAINFDPFGHTRGLVQILKKTGYEAYYFCRPLEKFHDVHEYKWPAEIFTWVGYDGSEVTACRAFNNYPTPRGKARAKVERFIHERSGQENGEILWGIGNHGGGPSHEDLAALGQLTKEETGYEIVHSTPENFFREIRASGVKLQRRETGLNPWAVGGYTTMIRIKQKYRKLENELFLTEKMLSHAAMLGLKDYSAAVLQEAMTDLATAQFHDILPGTVIPPVEEDSLRLLEHGLEEVARLKAGAFFALTKDQAPAKDGEIPVFIYNPHPYPVPGVFECEFNLADQHERDQEFFMARVYRGAFRVPSQMEQEQAHLLSEWRKRVVFAATLEPFAMNRFDCRFDVLDHKPPVSLRAKDGKIHFKGKKLEIIINTRTGLVDDFRVADKSYLKAGAFLPLVIADDDHSIGTFVKDYRRVTGEFRLMSPEESAAFSGVTGDRLEPVRVIEDGPVRTVVEAVFFYNRSAICLQYYLPMDGDMMEVVARVLWLEKAKMLKLSIPTLLEKSTYMGQVAYGFDQLPDNGNEAVAQKWVGAVSREDNEVFYCINDGTYGSDFRDGEIRLSLLRSPRYACLTREESNYGMCNDRYLPRVDQGERIFRFCFGAGRWTEKQEVLDREALIFNEKPYALSFFPKGTGKKNLAAMIISDPAVQLSCLKRAENGTGFIFRLFEPTGRSRSFNLRLPAAGMEAIIALKGFEVKTFYLDQRNKTLQETDMLEKFKDNLG